MPCSPKRCTKGLSRTTGTKKREKNKINRGCLPLVAVRLFFPVIPWKCQTCMPPRDAVPIRKETGSGRLSCQGSGQTQGERSLKTNDKAGIKRDGKGRKVAKIEKRRPMPVGRMLDCTSCRVERIGFVSGVARLHRTTWAPRETTSGRARSTLPSIDRETRYKRLCVLT